MPSRKSPSQRAFGGRLASALKASGSHSGRAANAAPMRQADFSPRARALAATDIYNAVVPLGSTGWKYHQTTLGDATDYSSPSFNDSGWSTGQAAFGNGLGLHSVNTTWPTDGRIWLRRTIPASSSRQYTISGLVDNYADIYWNGTLIAQVFGADNGGAEFGPILVPDSVVTVGPQYLAINASDDATPGDVCLIDVSVANGPAARVGPACGSTRFVPPNSGIGTSSSSYSNIGLMPAVGVTKASATSDLLVMIDFAAYATATGAFYVGVQLDLGTDYEMISGFYNTALQHQSWGAHRLFTGLPAGTHAFTPRWKVSSPTVLAANDNDTISLSVLEVGT